MRYNKIVKEGVRQVTLDDRRWYYRYDDDGNITETQPSTTWITKDGVPQGYGLKKWLANVGSWSESQELLFEAGDRGSRVHWAIEQILLGNTVTPDSIPFGFHFPLTAQDWRYILAFMNWFDLYRPLIINVEETVFGEFYAGTVDLVCLIDRGLLDSGGKKRSGSMVQCVVDWKTSGAIYLGHKLQGAAYMKSPEIEAERFYICRLGSRHKAGFEFLHVEDIDHYFSLFQCAHEFWKEEHQNPHPRFIEVPEKLSMQMFNDEEVTNGVA